MQPITGIYHMWCTPCFSYGDISHTLIPPAKSRSCIRYLNGLFFFFPTTAAPFTTNEPQSYVLSGRNHPLHINSWGGAGITLCGKGIYARGLAQETLALAVSLAPSSQLIDLPKKTETKFSDIGHIAVDKARIKSYYFIKHWSIQESKQERK